MRISKKHDNIAKQTMTMSNMEGQYVEDYEQFYLHKLGPDFYSMQKWSQAITIKR